MLRRRRILLQLLVLVVVSTSTAAFLGSGQTAEAHPPGVPAVGSVSSGVAVATAATARVAVAARNRALTVPQSFLGISTEYWTIPVWAAHIDQLKRVFSQITQGNQVVLRIGGDSANRALWTSAEQPPEWVFELTPTWLAQTSALVKALHVKLILDLNTVTDTASAAAAWVSIAERTLPRGSILGFEIGNEPDIYDPLAFKSSTGVTGPISPRLAASTDAATFRAYARALDRVVPQAPLLGPALADPKRNVSWITALLKGPHPGLAAITAHRYPLSACAHLGPTVPTIGRVLSEPATAGMAQSLKPAIEAAAKAHLPVRLTEFNSVTCGGTRGVSDTFATALWAPDALMELIQAGVHSAALHVRMKAINGAFTFSNSGGLVANPLLYGLVTYARMLGTHPQLLPARVTVAPGVDLKTWVVLDGDQLRVLLIDKSPRAANATLTLPATDLATVQRLLAPDPTATTGVTLAGQTLNALGLWSGPLIQTTVTPRAGTYTVPVPAMSAAIVTATASPGTT